MLEKITDQQLTENGVVSAPDKLEGDPKDNKAVFDRLVTQLVAGVVNQIIEAHNALDEGVNGRIDELVAELRDHVDVDPGNITAQNVGLLRELAERYGLTDKAAPTVHDALEVLERWAKLQPETAEAFGLGEGSTLDDAFKKVRSELDGGYPQVGDTLTTLRTDPGGGWLLCDGSPLRKKEYPALAKLCGVDTVDVVEEDIPFSGSELVGAECKHNAFAVLTAGGVYARRGEAGAWECVLDAAAENSGDTLLAVRHDGLAWNVLARSAAGENNAYWAYSATDVFGEWTRSLICETSRSYTLTPGTYHHCEAADGTCVFVCQSAKYSSTENTVTVYALVKEGNTWNERAIVVKNAGRSWNEVYGVYRAEGKWFVTLGYLPTSGAKYWAIVCMDSPDGSGAELHALASTSPIADDEAMERLRHMAGRWVTRGYVTLEDGSKKGYRVAVKETLLEGNWEHSEYENSVNSTSRIFFVCLGESGWLLLDGDASAKSGGKIRLHWLADLLGKEKNVDVSDVSMAADVAQSEDGTWFAFGKKYGENKVKTLTDAYEPLPTLTAQNAYVYIKAKEAVREEFPEENPSVTADAEEDVE